MLRSSEGGDGALVSLPSPPKLWQLPIIIVLLAGTLVFANLFLQIKVHQHQEKSKTVKINKKINRFIKPYIDSASVFPVPQYLAHSLRAFSLNHP